MPACAVRVYFVSRYPIILCAFMTLCVCVKGLFSNAVHHFKDSFIEVFKLYSCFSSFPVCFSQH